MSPLPVANRLVLSTSPVEAGCKLGHGKWKDCVLIDRRGWSNGSEVPHPTPPQVDCDDDVDDVDGGDDDHHQVRQRWD